MGLLEELKGLGVDVDGGLKRINGNEKLYTRLLGTFVKTMKSQAVTPDFDMADFETAKEKAHAIKGTSGNLSITPVYEAYTEIMNLMRTDKVQEARAELEKIQPVQDAIVSCIEKYM